ncbi:MAG: 16S rRNA (cytosine(1402)-N(4))-methyltransferase RsmH [Rickettsiales bacterium]|jgi:16S rRNA (cytosine1402-N4)-methyltransferase|nr:16S rRNA (cytosine(1402)-N(4))-methyltransferase RsmH [Rickettsiales bacterium]
MKHIPVLLNAVLEMLGDIRGKTIIDATFGAGGYSRAFLERGAGVIAFDRDTTVKKFADEIHDKNFQFFNKPFSEIRTLNLENCHVVFDFGVSSMQIDTPDRGFSWRFDAPLDMRMGGGITAGQLIEDSTVDELARILRDYGDVKKSRMFATIIKNANPKTTFQLRDLINNPKDIAPIFQALRIAVNDELGEIRTALNAVPELLGAGGICAAVSFHSLEDRIVKSYFRELTAPVGDPRIPVAAIRQWELLKTVRPDADELDANPRARSAHLRGIKKVL